MSRIKAITNDKKLIITSRPVLTSGSRNVDEFCVVFDKTWNFDNANYFVNFFIDSETSGVIRRLTVSGKVGTCDIPEYITQKDGFFHIGVFAKADDDVIKTSDIVGYEVKKGICAESDAGERYSVFEIKKQFIDMINDAIFGSALTYDMEFDNIDLNFSDYISSMYSALATGSSFIDSLYDIIKEYIDSDYEKQTDNSTAYVMYMSTLQEYLENIVPKAQFDSVSDELEAVSDLKSDVFNIIKEYIDSEFSVENDLSLYSFTIEERLNELDTYAQEHNEIINNLYNLYTGGNANV